MGWFLRLLMLAGWLGGMFTIPCLLVLCIPDSFTARSKLLLIAKAAVRKLWKYILNSSFPRLVIAAAQSASLGLLSSRCKAPRSFLAEAYGAEEAELHWRPNITKNPFHQEKYVVAWRCQRGHDEDLPWVEEVVKEGDNEYDDGTRCATRMWRYVANHLPSEQTVYFKVAATNIWGLSPWSEVIKFKTFAAPCKDGGYEGPLGPAGKDCGDGTYTWTQTSKDVTVRLPIGKDWKSRDIYFRAKPGRVEIRYTGSDGIDHMFEDDQVLLLGKFPNKIKIDEDTWEIETSSATGERHLVVQLVKEERMEKWSCLIDGDDHPKIDIRQVRFWNADEIVRGPGKISYLAE